MATYKSENSFEARSAESLRIRTRNPSKIPVIVEPNPYVSGAPLCLLDKKKFLVPVTFTMGQFYTVVRKRVRLNPEEALFIFFNGSHVATMSATIISLYETHSDPDGFLYATYSKENTFGSF